MKDEARSDFAIKDPDNETAAVITKSVPRGETVSFKYENAETGENEYISAMLVKDGEVLRYGQLAKPEAANGNVEFTIPSDIDYGTYELRLFNEQINGDYEADFASDFTTVTLEVGLSGGGTTENPYLINGLEDLEYFRNMVNSGKTDICAKLMNDITVNPGTFADDGSYTSAAEENLKAWTPIGLIKTEFVADNEKITLETVKNIYTGTFDGNGKTISGIYLNNAGSDYMGLFGVVGGSAKIKNLTLKNSYINGRSCVGGIVGYAKPEQIKEESDSEYIVTNKTATVSITDCRSEAVVCGTENVGGIVGRAELAEQTNDIVSAGKKNALDIQNCSNAGKIKCTDSNAGGIIGSVDVSGGVAAGVEQCANTGKVNGEKSVGGVVGSANVTAVTTTKTQKIPVISSSGGLTFKEERVTASDGSSFAISDCYNTAVIHGTEDVGGIAGRAYLTYSGTSGSIMVEIPDDGVQEISFSCCFNIGKVTARTTLDSGIAGYAVYNSVLMTKPQMLTAVADCYYQAEKAEVGMSGYGTELSGYGTDLTVSKSADAFASGEVAYLLQGTRTDSVWGQDIGTDKYPIFGGAKVYEDEYNSVKAYRNEIDKNEVLILGGDKKSATVALKEAGTYTIVFADYDGNRLANVKSFEVTVAKPQAVRVVSDEDFTLGTGDKIMLWDSFGNLTPLCDVYKN